MLPRQHNISYFRAPLILFHKCTKFYVILANKEFTILEHERQPRRHN